jgi:type I restriction enzyme S subunit
MVSKFMTWPTKKLGEICEIIAGQAPPSKYYNDEGKGIPFLTVNSFGNIYPKVERWTTKCLRESKEGDVLFSVAGSLGLVNLGINACITRSIFALRPLKSFVLQKFLFYTLKKYGSQIALMGSGTAQKVITINQLSKFEIPLPPLPVQQKIVKILDTIQSAVEIQEKIIEKTKELKKSLMAELFKYGAPSFRKGRKLKKTEIGEIPEDWEVVRLGDENLFELIMGQSPPSSSYNQNKKGLPFLQGKAEFGEIYPQPIKWCDKPIKIAEKNDILISVRAPVGDLNLADQKYCIGRGLAAIRLKNNVDPFFLFNCLNFFKNQILTYGTGSTFKAITKEILENFKIPLPPLPEQQEIAEILQTIDQKIEIEKKKKELYEELFRTILNKIMSQEIDVEKVRLE